MSERIPPLENPNDRLNGNLDKYWDDRSKWQDHKDKYSQDELDLEFSGTEKDKPSKVGKELELYVAPSQEMELYRPDALEDESIVSQQTTAEKVPIDDISKNIAPGTEKKPRSELHVVFVDQTRDAKMAAREAGEERLTRELNEGGRFKRVMKGIWKGGVAREYYRRKYIEEAHEDILDHNNIHHFDLEGDPVASTNAKMATIERFQSEYDEAINFDAGEKRGGANSEFATALKDLIRQNVEGRLPDNALEAEKNRLLFEHYSQDGVLPEDHARVDNLTNIALAVKGAIEHGESLDEVLGSMKISIGESRSGVRTEANYNKVDKLIEKMQNNKIGALVSPELVAAGASVAMLAAKVGTSKAIMIPGIGASVFAALRENKVVKDERAQHAREMARGLMFEDDAERRAEMDESIYSMESAASLTNSLSEIYENPDSLSSNEALEAALAALARVETRNKLSDQRSIDLIAYSSDRPLDSQRLDLAVARAKAKIVIEQNLTSEFRSSYATADESNPSLDDILELQSDMYIDSIEQDISSKDQVFRKLKRKRVLGAGTKALGTGLVIGIAAQELAAGMSTSRQGLIEQAWSGNPNGAESQTLLSGMVHGEEISGEYSQPGGEYIPHEIGENGMLNLPSNYDIAHNSDGTFNLVDSEGNPVVQNVLVNQNGSLPGVTIDQLRSHGIMVENTGYTTGTTEMVEKSVNAREYLENHAGETKDIKRDFWYDNNTSRADKNELGLHWGGDDRTGIGEDGAVTMSVAGMATGGSFQDGEAVSWDSAARDGSLKMFISASKETQGQAFVIDVSRDGTINIPADHPAAKLFSIENGQAQFNGAYAEVAEVGKVDADGTTHIRPLATEVGENHFGGTNPNTIDDMVADSSYEPVPEYKITPAAVEVVPYEMPIEAPPIIPVVSRRSLENVYRGDQMSSGPDTTPSDSRDGTVIYSQEEKPDSTQSSEGGSIRIDPELEAMLRGETSSTGREKLTATEAPSPAVNEERESTKPTEPANRSEDESIVSDLERLNLNVASQGNETIGVAEQKNETSTNGAIDLSEIENYLNNQKQASEGDDRTSSIADELRRISISDPDMVSRDISTGKDKVVVNPDLYRRLSTRSRRTLSNFMKTKQRNTRPAGRHRAQKRPRDQQLA